MDNHALCGSNPEFTVADTGDVHMVTELMGASQVPLTECDSVKESVVILLEGGKEILVVPERS